MTAVKNALRPKTTTSASSLTGVDRDADTRQLFRLHQACESPGLYRLDPRAEPRPTICVNRVAPIFAICRFLRRRFQRYEFEIPRPSHRTEGGQKKGSTAVSSKCWAGIQALPVPSKSSGGADPPHWTEQGHFKILGASAPKTRRPLAEGSSACRFFQE